MVPSQFLSSNKVLQAMTPSRTPQRSATPDSVKALMIVEAGIVGFLAFWLYSEYLYNVYFRIYVDNLFAQHIITYTAAVGLAIGLTGSVAAATLWRSLRQAKVKLENITPPKIKGSVKQILASLPTLDEESPPPAVKSPPPSSQVQPAVPPIQATSPQEQKK